MCDDHLWVPPDLDLRQHRNVPQDSAPEVLDQGPAGRVRLRCSSHTRGHSPLKPRAGAAEPAQPLSPHLPRAQAVPLGPDVTDSESDCGTVGGHEVVGTKEACTRIGFSRQVLLTHVCGVGTEVVPWDSG